MPSNHNIHLEPLPKFYDLPSLGDNVHALESCMETVSNRSQKVVTAIGGLGFAPDSAFTYLFICLGSFAAGALCSKDLRLLNILKAATHTAEAAKEGVALQPLMVEGLESNSPAASSLKVPLSCLRHFDQSQNQSELSSLAKRLNRAYDPSSINRMAIAPDNLEADVLSIERTSKGIKTTYRHGHYTLQEASGRIWLHQQGHMRVPISDESTSWWHDAAEDATWIKTKYYVEKRHFGGGFYRNYENGAVQIRRSNGEEFWESKFPERKRIWISHQEGISSKEILVRQNSLDK